MTYSIVARDAATGQVGIAVASRFFACGSLVPHLSPTAAIASQAFVNPLWGIEGLPRLIGGESATDVITDFIARDAGQSMRQAHMIGPDGQIAQHTGADCVPWAGHAHGTDVSVAGNMLTGPEVVSETLRAYEAAMDQPFVDRLLIAMQAGEDAGGDKRGRQAAGLCIHDGQPYPSLDLRVDDHADPLSELRRLYAVSEERLKFFSMGLATVENFSGMTDRSPIDEAITADEARRKDGNIKSQSHAVPPV
ncbi:MAG: DUF1028 domain-containing protein [Paracoccaceae bacterium]